MSDKIEFDFSLKKVSVQTSLKSPVFRTHMCVKPLKIGVS